MKKLPIIRHIRALILMQRYAYRAVFIWRLTYEEMVVSGMFDKDREYARAVWDGKA